MSQQTPFLPQGYSIPAGESNLLTKFPAGDTTIRILSPVTMGWMYWNLENRPVHTLEKPELQPNDAKIDEENPWNPQHFWSFVVWHYEDQAIKIAQITQKSIQAEIKKWYENPKWGNPTQYDLIINRVGAGKTDTKYSVQTNPPSEINGQIRDALAHVTIDLGNVFEDNAPVMISGPSNTQLPAGEAAPVEEVMTPEEQARATGAPSAKEEIELDTERQTEEAIPLEDIPF